MRIRRSLSSEFVGRDSFDRAQRPNLSRLLNRTSFIEANTQRKTMNVKQESMKRSRLGFEDFTAIVLNLEMKSCVVV